MITAINKGNHQHGRNDRNFCPFAASREYLALRFNYINDTDPFFVHKDNSPVTPAQVGFILRAALSRIDLDPMTFNTHSFCMGRTSDLIKYVHHKLY